MAPDAFFEKDVLSQVSVRRALGHITEPSLYGIINPLHYCQAAEDIIVSTHFSANCSFSPIFPYKIYKITIEIWSCRNLRQGLGLKWLYS